MDALAPTKARPVHVNVNNGGGETKRQNTIEDLRLENGTDPSLATPSISATEPGTVGRTGAITLSGRTQPVTEEIRNIEPKSDSIASLSSNNADIDRMTGSSSTLNRISPRSSGGAAKQPSSRMMIASAPRTSLPGIVDESALIPMISHVTGGSTLPTVSSNTVSVRPGESVDKIATRAGVRVSEIEKLNGLQHGAKLKGGSLIVPSSGHFDVAFDGAQIVFDVQPRVEAGVHIAPFRQIFEHTGGRLYWFGGTAQTVRAINDKREIEINIGNPKATVNNKPVQMEKKPMLRKIYEGRRSVSR